MRKKIYRSLSVHLRGWIPGDWEKLLSTGCDGYIEKPIELERIISQIRHLTGETA